MVLTEFWCMVGLEDMHDEQDNMVCTSVETNNYFGTNRISNIIRLMKIERIEYRILFGYQENIRILFEYLKIFEYIRINLHNCKFSRSLNFLQNLKTYFY